MFNSKYVAIAEVSGTRNREKACQYNVHWQHLYRISMQIACFFRQLAKEGVTASGMGISTPKAYLGLDR